MGAKIGTKTGELIQKGVQVKNVVETPNEVIQRLQRIGQRRISLQRRSVRSRQLLL